MGSEDLFQTRGSLCPVVYPSVGDCCQPVNGCKIKCSNCLGLEQSKKGLETADVVHTSNSVFSNGTFWLSHTTMKTM